MWIKATEDNAVVGARVRSTQPIAYGCDSADLGQAELDIKTLGEVKFVSRVGGWFEIRFDNHKDGDFVFDFDYDDDMAKLEVWIE